MSSTGKRFRSSTACTNCRQQKMKCDRRERMPNRCTRCGENNQKCEISSTFERRRMKGGFRDDAETKQLREELEHLKGQVASLIPTNTQSPVSMTQIASPVSTASITTPRVTGARFTGTKPRSSEGFAVQPWQIDAAFSSFFKDMHPFMPFIEETSPNICYDREPFLFWTICMLGLRSQLPDLAKGLAPLVTLEAMRAPLRSCHDQAAATSVVQGLLLLSLWPFHNPSLLHESAWLQCGSATHLAIHLGLHQPYAASEFVPESGREHIPNHFVEFRRTWIAVYIINCLISFARGYPTTVRADFNIIEYTLSSPSTLMISPDLFKHLLIARRIEEGQDLGHSRTGEHGHIDPGSREGIYRLLQSRISDTEKRAQPLSPYIQMIMAATKLQPAIQVLQSTSPIPLQETTILSAWDNASSVITLARLVQSQTNMVHLPVFVDALVLMSAVLIFKVHISRFSLLVNGATAQRQISEACGYFREGVNDFNDVPARVSIFVEALYSLVAENLVPVGGFIIENTKSRYSQNILYEVLWTFKEWKRQRIALATSQPQPIVYPAATDSPQTMDTLSFLDDQQLDPGFWDMLEGL